MLIEELGSLFRYSKYFKKKATPKSQNSRGVILGHVFCFLINVSEKINFATGTEIRDN